MVKKYTNTKINMALYLEKALKSICGSGCQKGWRKEGCPKHSHLLWEGVAPRDPVGRRPRAEQA